MNLNRGLRKTFLQVGIYKYSSEIMAFLGSIVISRLLTPSEYGVIAMVAVGYLFIARFSNPGYTDLIVRDEDSTEYRYETQWIFTLHGLLLCFAMCLIAYPISWFYQDQNLVAPALVYGMILFLYALPGASESFLIKKKKLTLIFKTEFWGTLIGLLLTILLAFLGASYWSLILPHLLIPVFYYAVYQMREPVPWKLSALFSFGTAVSKFKPLVTRIGQVNLVEYWEDQTDNFWIGRLQGSAVLGVYNRAFLVSHLPRSLLKPLVNSILLPQWQKYLDHRQEVNLAYRSLIRLILGMMALPMTLLMLYPRPISVWLWGGQWSGVAPFLGILALVMGFQVVCSTSRTMFVLARKEQLFTRYAWTQGSMLILVVTVAVFISMKTLVLSLALVVLLIKVPAFSYWCLRSALNLTWYEIINLLGIPWAIHLLLWVMLALGLNEYLIIPLSLLVGWSMVILYQERRIFIAYGKS